jgi:DNA-binding GntR family transcriptional regulator
LQPSKKYLYVEIYEKLYEEIVSGKYQTGDKLPSENDLSQMLDVSRGTLRQALLLLKENGYIYNVKGSGSYIADYNIQDRKTLDKLHMIPKAFAIHELTEKIEKFVYEVPTTYSAKQLNLNKSQLTLNCHKIFKHKGEPVAYSFIVVPVLIIEKYQVDITKESNIAKFIDNIIDLASYSKAKIIYTEAGEFLKKKFQIKLHEKIVVIEEIFYSEDSTPLASMRHSMVPDNFEFFINRTRNR